MSLFQRSTSGQKQWRALLAYNCYRPLSICLLLGIYLVSLTPHNFTLTFFLILYVYFIFALFAFFVWSKRLLNFDNQVLMLGVVDILAVSILLILINNQQLGYGILLNVTVAALSIIAPGRLAIFFAAMASFLLLCGNILLFLNGHAKNIYNFYYCGIYGAGFFATAITAWYLSKLVRASEVLAQHRSDELAAMQRINEYIVGRLNSGVVYVDEISGIRLINAAAQEMFGAVFDRPKNLQDLSPKLREKYEYFLKAHKNKEGMEQATLQNPYLRVHFFSTAVAKNTAVLIVLEDMSFVAQQALQLKLASLGRFSASIAHELRNPLGIVAHAAQLLDEHSLFNTEDERLKQLIISNCDRMNRVIKNVLQLSRQQKSHPQILELCSFLKAFKANFDHTNRGQLAIEVPENELFTTFDKSQLEQVLVNLCDNSIQHGRDALGNVKMLIAIKILGHKISILLSDSGPGLSKSSIKNMFEPFFTTLAQGTGMGLFISKELCEANGAQLQWLKTNKGCTFSIQLNALNEMIT